jgi:hypothetical protein
MEITHCTDRSYEEDKKPEGMSHTSNCNNPRSTTELDFGHSTTHRYPLPEYIKKQGASYHSII